MILAEDIILSLLGDNRLRELDWGHSENVKQKATFKNYRWIFP